MSNASAGARATNDVVAAFAGTNAPTMYRPRRAIAATGALHEDDVKFGETALDAVLATEATDVLYVEDISGIVGAAA